MTPKTRRRFNKVYHWVCRLCLWFALSFLILLLYEILKDGIPFLSKTFLTNFPSRFPAKAGVKSALYGTFYVMFLTAVITVPIGVGAALFLAEYANAKSKRVELLRINIANLAGMPSIIYGLVGLAVFVRYFNFERSLISGALTLSLLILPVVILASEAAIKAVPDSIRHAAFALGARKWQVVIGQVLPAATPGIMTGIILSLSRAIGETAPLILVGALSFVAFVPQSMFDAFTVMPVQVYNWASRPQEEFQQIAASAILVLLVVLFIMNSAAVYIRMKFQRYKL
jgi:phosphate transport system permease protein